MIDQISTIRKLHMVQVYHLFGESGPVTGILAYYQDKTVNLCSADPYYPELLDQLAKVYDRESRTGRIIADEETKAFLERANDFSADEFEERLSGFTKTQMPVILPKAFTHCFLLPILKYVMETIYGTMKESITFDPELPPWFGKGTIAAVAGKKARRFAYRIRTLREGRYDLTVRDVLMAGNTLKMEVLLGRDGVTVSYRDTLYGHEGNIRSRIGKNGACVEHGLKNDEGVIFETVTDCPCVDRMPTELVAALATGGRAGWKAYVLPWKDVIFEAQWDGVTYRIYDARGEGMTVSSAYCFQELTAGDEPDRFGKFAFRLYEREDVTELHLLDLEYPGSGRFQNLYSGKYYVKNI